jgi:hypothetical protein
MQGVPAGFSSTALANYLTGKFEEIDFDGNILLDFSSGR